MTSYCDVTNSVYPVTMTTIRNCSILEFGGEASNQAVAPGITRPCTPLRTELSNNLFSPMALSCVCKQDVGTDLSLFRSPEEWWPVAILRGGLGGP